jgi:hypothetical protein
MVRKSHIFCYVTVCRQVNSYWRFRRTCRLSAVYQLTECNTPTRLEPWVFMDSLSQRKKTNSPRFIVHSLQRPRSYWLLWKSVFITACAKAPQWTLFWTTWIQSTSHIILVKSQLSCYPSICECFKWSLPPSCTVNTFSLPSYLFCWYCIEIWHPFNVRRIVMASVKVVVAVFWRCM